MPGAPLSPRLFARSGPEKICPPSGRSSNKARGPEDASLARTVHGQMDAREVYSFDMALTCQKRCAICAGSQG